MNRKPLTPKSFGKRLREERLRLGLTQGELADAAGVQRATVYQYEKGSRRPSLDFLIELLPVGLSWGYMMFGDRKIFDAEELRMVDADLAGDLHKRVDRYGVDSKGRLLQSEHRNALFRQLVEMALNLKKDEVDTDAIHEVLEAFAA